MDRAVRLSWPDVEALQVWDLKIGETGTRFQDAVSSRRVRRMRAMGAPVRVIATLLAEAIVAGCHAVNRSFEEVYLTGGVSMTPGLQTALNRLSTPWPIVVGGAGRHYAGVAKSYLFGEDKIIVVDVGQTAIKLFMPSGDPMIVFERDVDLLPFGHCIDKGDRAIQFIRSVIEQARAVAPDAPVLLSLPAPVSADLVPGENNYGFGGCKTFVQEVAPDPTCLVFVINDAELAAECARGESSARPCLVLSLGLGPGGALLKPG